MKATRLETVAEEKSLLENEFNLILLPCDKNHLLQFESWRAFCERLKSSYTNLDVHYVTTNDPIQAVMQPHKIIILLMTQSGHAVWREQGFWTMEKADALDEVLLLSANLSHDMDFDESADS